jgi:hypothetical protein
MTTRDRLLSSRTARIPRLSRKTRLLITVSTALCLLGTPVVAAHAASARPDLGGEQGPDLGLELQPTEPGLADGFGDEVGRPVPRPNPIPPVAEEPGPDPVASFDYSVPEGPKSDADGNGVADLPPARSIVHRDQWPIDLDGCASDGRGAAITSYEWAVAFPTEVVRIEGADCRARATAPAQGTYRVTLTVRTDSGRTSTTTGSVTVRDYLIVSIGDSYASGEGNPDILPAGGQPIGTWRLDEYPPTWADKPCHRSWTSGPALAAEQIEKADPRTSVTFVSVACSGATIAEGLLGEYATPPGRAPGDKPLTAQVEQVRRLLCPREDSRYCLGSSRSAEPLHIDALMIGIGGNDIGFGPIVRKCAEIFVQGKECHLRQDVLDDVRQGFQNLPGQYRKLDEKLRSTLSYSDAYLPEYPNPLFDADEQICDELIFEDAKHGVNGRVSNAEAAWANSEVVARLNQEVHTAAGVHGWKSVDGISEEGLPHGYCADDHWVNRYEESRYRIQGDEYGTMHPNRSGHEMAARHLVSSIAPDLPPVSRPSLQQNEGCPGAGDVPELGDLRGCHRPGTPPEIVFSP